MKTKSKFYRIALLAMCLTLLAGMVAAAFPQPAQAAQVSDPYLTFSAWIEKGKVHIDVGAYTAKAKYQVKLRDAVAADKWYKVGVMKLVKNTKASFVYPLPKALAHTLYIQVCLKNQTNNKLNCKTVINPGT